MYGIGQPYVQPQHRVERSRVTRSSTMTSTIHHHEASPSAALDPRIRAALQQYWGFDTLRPLQAEAIDAGIEHRDSLVVLPTGGGKSLCYQVPPLMAERMDVVISPLISLMKDQVDGLRQNGYPAAAVHSGLTPAERAEIRDGVLANRYRLLFVSPERLMAASFQSFLAKRDVRAFAIDEAHCISQWGHDFRPEYRQLATLKQRFPQASVHAYTATATPRVQKDIVEQLGLNDARVLVGTFDRPNLVYRVLPARDIAAQTLQVVRRHRDEASIVYCISRKDTEAMAEFLQANGVKAAAYHAGLEKAERSRVQEAFAAEKLDVVAATVAFGMGIDRSNVRCVIHAAMPKTVEHYQQETGRAGRDALEAECVLLYTYGDVKRWERLISRSAENAPDPEPVIAGQLELLQQMASFCNSAECRHRALSRYFGQRYPKDDCDACDVCLGEVDSLDDATTIARKILSGVFRLEQRFGVKHLCDVLRGGATAQITRRGHDTLSVHGILKDLSEKTIQNLIYQLIEQGILDQSPGDRPVLTLNDESRSVLRGEREIKLIDPGSGPQLAGAADSDQWEGVDRELFDELRRLRREIARERQVPAFVIFSDATLRAMAARRPTSIESMHAVPGIGAKKLAELGPRFLELIQSFCEAHERSTDVEIVVQPRPPGTKKPNPPKDRAMTMFREGRPVDEVSREIGRAESTTWRYLAEFIELEKPAGLQPWIDAPTYQRVVEAMTTSDSNRLSPIHEALNREIPYEVIRLVVAHQQAVAGV